ncbi:EAL domain-containing protein [Peribacillus deserti]|uniref:EAL domain-containing protein n=1 Tax=Peribacillus deserti TaxID=673318 RepID=A0A2N5MBP6_9BACI|nr:EAL domain-containing protein [Peribacillus deserti]PLT31768.1 hypothetical protein CUU66_00990 [Peribacillus deserti]
MNEKNLKPVYQPIIHLETNRVLGFEANIIGLEEDGTELRYPDLLKRNIKNLDFIARDKAITQFKIRQKGFKLFVNAEPEEMDIPLFYEDVDLTNVVLEITENSSMKNPTRTNERITFLRRKGLEIALDDFGSNKQNYDKLSISPDFIKLDKLFIKEEGLLRKMASLTGDYKVILEGIEDTKFVDIGKELGIMFGQGFALGRPMPYEEVTTKIINGDYQVMEYN